MTKLTMHAILQSVKFAACQISGNFFNNKDTCKGVLFPDFPGSLWVVDILLSHLMLFT